jgi:hypothetical protein
LRRGRSAPTVSKNGLFEPFTFKMPSFII